MNDSTALVVALGPSRSLCALLAAGHLLAAWAVLASIDHPLVALPVGAGLLFSLVHNVRVHGLRTASSAVVQLRLGSDGTVLLHRRDGSGVSGRIDASSIALPWVAIVGLARAGRMRDRLRPGRYVVVASDTVSAEAHRRLRVRMRWMRGASEEGGGRFDKSGQD